MPSCMSVSVSASGLGDDLAHQLVAPAVAGFCRDLHLPGFVHLLRLIGLIALLPQHLDPDPFGFTHTYLLQVGWGDAIAAVLAAIAIWAVLEKWRSAMFWAWALVIEGTFDTLNAGPQFLIV